MVAHVRVKSSCFASRVRINDVRFATMVGCTVHALDLWRNALMPRLIYLDGLVDKVMCGYDSAL